MIFLECKFRGLMIGTIIRAYEYMVCCIANSIGVTLNSFSFLELNLIKSLNT